MLAGTASRTVPEYEEGHCRERTRIRSGESRVSKNHVSTELNGEVRRIRGTARPKGRYMIPELLHTYKATYHEQDRETYWKKEVTVQEANQT